MRNKIWNLVRLYVPEGMILPWWALIIRAILYPLQFFYWRMSQRTGYQFESDTWLINGVRYSGDALLLMSKAQGEVYRITRNNDVITLEKFPNA